MGLKFTELIYVYSSVSQRMFRDLQTFNNNKDSLSLVMLMKGFNLSSKLRSAESSQFEVQQLDARYIVDFVIYKNNLHHTVIKLQTSGLVPDHYTH